MKKVESGYTLVELMLSLVVLVIIGLAFFDLFISLLHSAVIAQRQAVATTLANNQMEYLKSLPYNNLAVTGGAIPATTTIPAKITKKVNGDTYTVTTSIVYVDDAYDGCGSYPTQALKQQYCRSYPPPTGAPALDTNPADYKDVNVVVTDNSGLQLASVDSQISALVAETASNTGALFVKVVDNSGNPVEGATVQAVDSTVSPAITVSSTTDQNGLVIFYDLTPDGGYDYTITASNAGYSTLATIATSGSLQPTYPNQKLITQNSSYVTMMIEPQGQNSLLLETTTTTGTSLPNAKIYVKGGYKKYTLSTNTAYYYDTLTPTDTRPVSDSNGLAGLTNLVPGDYYFCGDTGATSCSVGGTTYYLAAAVPYGGSNPLYPITVPTYSSDNPPTTTYPYGGANYLQKVRLMLTTSSTFPRVASISPYDGSLASGTLSNLAFTINGVNLPCSSNAASCTTKVSFLQNGNTYNASCTGSSSGVTLTCTINLASASAGNTQLVITVGSNTLTLPASPLIGGFIVTQ
jgi:type II secretory pathway pseudopilin PulG